jgi:hypothetical protein
MTLGIFYDHLVWSNKVLHQKCSFGTFCQEKSGNPGYGTRLKLFIPGVDVMITIFCDFRQFLAKNGVFLEKQCYDENFA